MALTLKQYPVYDFSSWEDNIKWDSMTGASKPLAVVMRASIQGAGTRNRFEDVTAVPYVNECKKRGLKYGLYHFLSPHGIAEQAALFLSVWKKCEGADLAPIVDVEINLPQSYPHTSIKGASSVGNAVWQSHVKTFIDLVAAGTGRTPIIYTNQSYWSYVCTKSGLFWYAPTWTKDYPLWVAQYPYEPDTATKPAALPLGWDNWIMWQYSDKGRQNGLLANDLNTCSEAYALELGSIVTPPGPDPEPEPEPINTFPDKVGLTIDGVQKWYTKT